MAQNEKICPYFRGCERIITECYVWNSLDGKFKERNFDNSPVRALIDSCCQGDFINCQAYLRKKSVSEAA